MDAGEKNEQYIFKKELREGFTTVSNDIFDTSKLSLGAIGLACLIISKSTNWEVKIEYFASICQEKEKAIRALLKELAVAGYMMRVRKHNANGTIRTVTLISDYPRYLNVGTAEDRIKGYMVPATDPPFEEMSVNRPAARGDVGKPRGRLTEGSVDRPAGEGGVLINTDQANTDQANTDQANTENEQRLMNERMNDACESLTASQADIHSFVHPTPDDPLARSVALLTDPDVELDATKAHELAAKYEFDLLERHIFAWLHDAQKGGKYTGLGALIYRIEQNFSARPLTTAQRQSELYRRHHADGERAGLYSLPVDDAPTEDDPAEEEEHPKARAPYAPPDAAAPTSNGHAPAQRPIPPVQHDDPWAIALSELSRELPLGYVRTLEGSRLEAAGEVESQSGLWVPCYRVEIAPEQAAKGLIYFRAQCGPAIRRKLSAVLGKPVLVEIMAAEEAAEREVVS